MSRPALRMLRVSLRSSRVLFVCFASLLRRTNFFSSAVGEGGRLESLFELCENEAADALMDLETVVGELPGVD